MNLISKATAANLLVYMYSQKKRKGSMRMQLDMYSSTVYIVNVVMWYQLRRNKSEHPIPFPMWPFGASLLFGASVAAVSVASSAELSLPITKREKK